MQAKSPKYMIDTCSITAMRRIYPKDVFPGVWDKISGLAESGVLISSDQVLEELRTQDDVVLEWAEKHDEIFLPLDEAVQKKAMEILEHHDMIDLKRRKSGADPFVVATAIVNSCSVVTEEKASGDGGKPKIPNVCKAYKVECISLLDMLKREGLKL